MFARRRPLARAAVIGGTAAYAGKRHAESQAREADEQARIAELEAQQYQAPAAVAAPAPAEDPIETLRQLGELHDQGILTDAEEASITRQRWPSRTSAAVRRSIAMPLNGTYGFETTARWCGAAPTNKRRRPCAWCSRRSRTTPS